MRADFFSNGSTGVLKRLFWATKEGVPTMDGRAESRERRNKPSVAVDDGG